MRWNAAAVPDMRSLSLSLSPTHSPLSLAIARHHAQPGHRALSGAKVTAAPKGVPRREGREVPVVIQSELNRNRVLVLSHAWTLFARSTTHVWVVPSMHPPPLPCPHVEQSADLGQGLMGVLFSLFGLLSLFSACAVPQKLHPPRRCPLGENDE